MPGVVPGFRLGFAGFIRAAACIKEVTAEALTMDRPAEAGQRAALSDYLAAERTLLAWIRTGLALMGFGFVVARFGIFLQQIQVMQGASAEPYGLSLWFGTALIGVGVVVNVFAGWNYIRLVRELDRGETSGSRSSIQAVVIAFSGVGWIGYGDLSGFDSDAHEVGRWEGEIDDGQ